MKKTIKFLTIALATLSMIFSFIACEKEPEDNPKPKDENEKPTEPDYFAEGESEYTSDTFTITAIGENDKIYVVSEKELVLISKQDVDNDEAAPAYNLEGIFEGKIINKTKGSVLNLLGVQLSNIDEPAIYGEKKIELSAKKGTSNTITVTKNETSEKFAAVECEKGIEIGGAGTLLIQGNIYHGVKGGDVKVKGSGNITIQGTKSGSAINCETFFVKEDSKVFTLNLKNSKNGIKAETSIEILRGILNLEGLETAFKTDTDSEDSPERFIHLGNPESENPSTITINCSNVKTLYKTNPSGYKKAPYVTITGIE